MAASRPPSARGVMLRWTATLVALLLPVVAAHAQRGGAAATDIWTDRDTIIGSGGPTGAVRIAIWDSGVDTTLFASRLARDARGRILVRGYDAHKRRQDTPMALLPPAVLARADELNRVIIAYDDLESGLTSEHVSWLEERRRALTPGEEREFDDAIDRWSGYSHGTGVADIALAGLARAEIVIARMEWWAGSPPVPCWTRELAVREAESIRDLLAYLVESGARVVNMSWGRAERGYLRNMEECAPGMPLDERQSLARFTVDTIRAVLQAGMRAAPRVLFVGAAGNAGTSVETANPATRFEAPNFLLVGAVDRAGARAPYTNVGPEVSLYANGERVPARLPGGMPSFPTGTSMATPNVSNAAAKMLAVNPALTGAELRALLLGTSDRNATGDRLIHTRRAVAAARAAMGVR
ncbi:MAG: S8 family serine peptidase [Gemmatimonadetes bacterium]|nr:S8 family serine peptidase [Gemmatimonadota bacterium]